MRHFENNERPSLRVTAISLLDQRFRVKLSEAVRHTREKEIFDTSTGGCKMSLKIARTLIISLALLIALADARAQNRAASGEQIPTRTQVALADEARHQLLTLPYYGIFDWLEGQVLPDATVVLRGQVVRPTTKSDAEARVRRIEGVAGVNNQIEVLPLSPNDERLRRSLYRALFNSNSPLFRYATQSVPSIHIIVKRGRATLKGVVANRGDSRLAFMRARGVPGLFDVKNELQV
ncbi:MAG TPA: BON domain-containing protein, partial [Pyrinomonadaceae bacterium]